MLKIYSNTITFYVINNFKCIVLDTRWNIKDNVCYLIILIIIIINGFLSISGISSRTWLNITGHHFYIVYALY